MSKNLLVWKWSADFDAASKRKKRGLKFADVVAAFAADERHPAMATHDFARFDAALTESIGPEEADGPYILERYPNARVANLPNSRAADLIPRIGRLAQTCGLVAAEF